MADMKYPILGKLELGDVTTDLQEAIEIRLRKKLQLTLEPDNDGRGRVFAKFDDASEFPGVFSPELFSLR